MSHSTELLALIGKHFKNCQQAKISEKLTIEYKLHGNNDAPEKVVFIMGLFTSKESWAPIIDTLLDKNQDTYQLLTFDNRGVGGSNCPLERFTTSIMAKDTILLMDYLNWKKVHLVGISMGGMISLEIATLFPERLLSLSLLVTSMGFMQGPLPGLYQLEGMLSILKNLFTKDERIVAKRVLFMLYPEIYLNKHIKNIENDTIRIDNHNKKLNDKTVITNRDVLFDFHLTRIIQRKKVSIFGVFGQLFAVLTHNISKRRLMNNINNHSIPKLIIAADMDRLLHPKNSINIYNYLKGTDTKLLIYENCGHGLILQQKNEVTKELLDNFNKVK